MPKKKSVPKKTSKKKPAPAKKAARPAAAARKSKAAGPKVVARAPKPAAKKAAASKPKTAARLTPESPANRPQRTPRSRGSSPGGRGSIEFPRRGLGSAAGGQSGDTEGLSSVASADSESVEELEEEGQSFEAEAVRGVEDAPDPDEAEVTTHEVPEDDVPGEYDDQ
jgi:hypothetical protein